MKPPPKIFSRQLHFLRKSQYGKDGVSNIHIYYTFEHKKTVFQFLHTGLNTYSASHGYKYVLYMPYIPPSNFDTQIVFKYHLSTLWGVCLKLLKMLNAVKCIVWDRKKLVLKCCCIYTDHNALICPAEKFLFLWRQRVQHFCCSSVALLRSWALL